MAERSTAVGIFENHRQAEQAIHALEQAGFRDDQIGFIMRGSKQEGIAGVISGVVGGVIGGADAALLPGIGPTDAGIVLENAIPLSEEAVARFLPSHPKVSSEKGTASAEGQPQAQEATAHDEMRSAAQEQAGNTENGENLSVPVTKIPIGEAEGAVGGSIVGGLVAAAASLLIPGIGPALAGGILITALGGAAIGAFAGSLLGVFADMGIPREEAHYYQRQLEAGHVLVTARAEGRVQEARDILRQNGATLYK